MNLSVYHRTRYLYASPVRDSHNEARLAPRPDGGQSCRTFRLELDPPVTALSYRDLYGNTFHLFEVPGDHESLTILSTSLVETPEAPPLTPEQTTVALHHPLPKPVPEGWFDFRGPSPLVPLAPQFKQEAVALVPKNEDAWHTALALMHHVHGTMSYLPQATTVHTMATQVAQTRIGVCQDYAHLLLGLTRSIGLAARYVSGYLYNGPKETLRGAQASHAWVEVYIPETGWVGLDPTNDQVVSSRHVKVAHGRDYRDVPPVKGTYRGTGTRELNVEVSVQIAEAVSP